MKTQLMKRAAALCLAVVLTLSVNAAALFGGKGKGPAGRGEPTAPALEIHLPGHSLSRPVSGRGRRGEDPDLHRGERAQKGHRPD